jgi:hypothetical protein
MPLAPPVMTVVVPLKSKTAWPMVILLDSMG